ncbi:ComEC/Rec2 family competence protein [Pseudomonas lini]|uniref:Metal-dependent hydrolase, beta-lactamase superfamily II n=1 Tax=Pseudomonas lini TaxID=163011 RepID=A0A1H2BAG6_9PSED|nr:hypothetical protein [Pseudomonas lini]KAB0498273.1 hypothetical protein F7R14_27430 [Pseudomonas lini]SDT55213.1 Metal-dependent hydrolase, beta-lactamase superfamily II [Pseudomonas lini]
MLFYVQQVNKEKGSNFHQVVLDFATSSDHVSFARLLNDRAALDGSVQESSSSMIRFSYEPNGYSSFREGSWYEIDPKAFDSAEYVPVEMNAAGGLFLGAELNNVPWTKVSHAKKLAPPQVATVSTVPIQFLTDPDPTGIITLTVVNCGHANWNEIETPSDRIIYDVGASRLFTKAEVRAIIDSRTISTEKRPICLFISHWDVDHYLALLEFTPIELAKLRNVVVPSQVPNTATFERVRRLLADNNVPLTAIPPAERPPKSSRVIALAQHWRQGAFTLFRATSGRARNQTGIVLGVQGSNQVALLTGDHHYDKVLAASGDVTSYSKTACVLVTPHHGGAAGNVSAKDWQNFFSTLTTPISCGANSYGHPIGEVEAALNSMQSGVPLWRTDQKGTWITTL